jgi:hypothetical protein
MTRISGFPPRYQFDKIIKHQWSVYISEITSDEGGLKYYEK